MNILFTCAGRRNYLLNFFRDSLGSNDRILAADMDSTAPAMAAADKGFVVPGVYTEKYVDTLLSICREERVNALIPLNDLELPILARNKSRFRDIGVILIISNENVIETCSDKYRTIAFCDEICIKSPTTFLEFNGAKESLRKGHLHFPLVVKPRWGTASIGIEFPRNIEELELAFRLVSIKLKNSILYEVSRRQLDRAVMIQQRMEGTEFHLDILNDFSGKTVQVYVKEKLAMRAGETDKAVLRNKPDLEELGFLIGNNLGHIGNVDCDIIEKEKEYYLLEMNPRFGGGYPFSHMAGANYPAAIVLWIENCVSDFQSFKRIYDQPYAKCDTLIEVVK